MRDASRDWLKPSHCFCSAAGDLLVRSSMCLKLLLFLLRQMRDHVRRHSTGEIGVEVSRSKYAVIHRPSARCFSVKIKPPVAVVSPHSGLALNKDEPACLRPPTVRIRGEAQTARGGMCKIYRIFRDTNFPRLIWQSLSAEHGNKHRLKRWQCCHSGRCRFGVNRRRRVASHKCYRGDNEDWNNFAHTKVA